MVSDSANLKYKAIACFVGGLAAALLLATAALQISGWSLVSQEARQQWQETVARLEAENRFLEEERLRAGWPEGGGDTAFELPYNEQADAHRDVTTARRRAIDDGKFLMVTFGANWCLDCRTLYRNLRSAEVADYTKAQFRFVSVDVGKFNRNRELADELGVDLSRGIPVAIFFAPDGSVIGTTNEGQLEPARLYSSKQILRFMKDIAERMRVVAPDSVGSMDSGAPAFPDSR